MREAKTRFYRLRALREKNEQTKLKELICELDRPMDKFAGCILGRIVFAPWQQERDEIKFAYLPPIARIFVALKTSKSDKPSLVKLVIYATPTGLNSTEFKCKRRSETQSNRYFADNSSNATQKPNKKAKMK